MPKRITKLRRKLLQIKVKRLNADGILPSYARYGDAGMDLFASERTFVAGGSIARIKTGIAVEIPFGFVGLCWDKSGLAMNKCLKVLGGVIDSGYRGELILGVFNFGHLDYTFERGDKVMQMLIQPVSHCSIMEVSELSPSERGADGFGSSGK